MNAIRLTLAVAWKEIQIIVKDRGSLAILFVLPLVISSLYGAMNRQFAGPAEQPNILIDVSLVNEDLGIFGAEVAEALGGISVLRVETLDTVQAAEERVAGGLAAAAIVLPTTLTEAIAAYEPVAISVITDPAEPEAAGIVAAIMEQVGREIQVWGEVQHGVRQAREESGALAGAPPEAQAGAEAQAVGAIMTALGELRQNPALSLSTETLAGAQVASGANMYFALLFPGITVMFVFFIVGMAAAGLLIERETGTLRRLLSAPIPRVAVIGGKALAFTLLACAQVVVLFSVGHFAFGMPLGRSAAGLIVLTVLLGMVATAFGLMIASLSRSPKQADNLGTMLAFVMAGLGGAIAIGPTPAPRAEGIRGLLARLTPQGNAVEGYYSLMAENGALGDITPQLLALAVMLVLFVGIASWKFRYEG